MDPKKLGQLGEEVAARFLEERGWRILGRNVRVGRRELDLIARRGRTVAFVEVKSRVGDALGDPLEAIGARKRRDVAAAAAGWLREQRLPADSEFRFDAVGVVWSGSGPVRVIHLPDAWMEG